MTTELNKIYDKIAYNSIKNDPFESGGYVKKDFSIKFFQSVHLHSEVYAPPHDFYLDIINFKKDILFCFHSHMNNEKASENDLKFIKVYNLDSLIYIIDSKKFLSVNTKYEKNYFSWHTKSIG